MVGGTGESSPDPELRITLLGAFSVRAAGREVPPADWKRRSAVALVKILALTPGHRLHREQLMELLWPASAPEQAGNNLHQALYAARRALGDEAFERESRRGTTTPLADVLQLAESRLRDFLPAASA